MTQKIAISASSQTITADHYVFALWFLLLLSIYLSFS